MKSCTRQKRNLKVTAADCVQGVVAIDLMYTMLFVLPKAEQPMKALQLSMVRLCSADLGFACPYRSKGITDIQRSKLARQRREAEVEVDPQ